MTTLSHIDPVFGSVFSIQALNNPMENATLTPGYGNYQQNFVLMMRLVEMILGVDIKETNSKLPKLSYSQTNISFAFTDVASNAADKIVCPQEVLSALGEAHTIIEDIVKDLCQNDTCLEIPAHINTEPLVAKYVNITDYTGPNPAEVAIGPTSYDHHVFFADDGGTERNQDTRGILESVFAPLPIPDTLAHYGNVPHWFGEWTLTNQIGKDGEADQFLRDYGDAQNDCVQRKTWGGS
ncbi:hypothetical protein MPER_01436, partial [Moniliophthora perniciosa FA553]